MSIALPSADHRNRLVRSPHCPNRQKTCGSCAWGFYSPEGAGTGEDPSPLGLTPLDTGYRSQCGSVELYRDKSGRIGALRDGRFFPGIENNPAYERYLTEHPELREHGTR